MQYDWNFKIKNRIRIVLILVMYFLVYQHIEGGKTSSLFKEGIGQFHLSIFYEVV